MMENICRTCLTSLNEFTSSEIDVNLKMKIELLTSIQISQDSENFPPVICGSCLENINKYYCFRIVVIKSDEKLRERYEVQKSKKQEQKQYTKRKRKKSSKHSVVIIEERNIPDVKVEVEEETSDNLSEARSLYNNHLASDVNNERVNEHSFVAEIKAFVENDIVKDTFRNEDVELEKTPNCYISGHDGDEENTHIQHETCSNSTIKTHKNNSSLLCEECNLTFSSKAEVINHKRSLHTAPGICNICGAVVRADNLSKHVQTHNEEPVVCKICGKFLKNSQSLRTHLLIHRGVTYTCDICGRTSKVKSEHSRHMKTHVDPNARKTMCTICGKRVRHLKHHILTHTGEKPHVCRHCNKGFTSTYSLKVHSRQHTDEKPFICECCSMAFNQKVSLLSHLKSRHGANSE